MNRLRNKFMLLSVVGCCLGSPTVGVEATDDEMARKKDFLLVKSEIVKKFGNDFRRKNPYINEYKLDLEVASDPSLGVVANHVSPYKAASVDKMFHTQAAVKNYILQKRDETNAWIHFTQKFMSEVDVKQYDMYPTFSNVRFSQRFQDFLEHKKNEQNKWGDWLKAARTNAKGMVLAPKRHPHEITGVNLLQEMGLKAAGAEVCVWDCGFFKNKHVNYVRDVPSLPGNFEEGEDPGNAQHGTHVSGIVGAKESAGSWKGVAPGVSIFPVVYNGVDEFIKEIQDSKARVINGSFSFLLKKEDIGSITRLTEELKKHDRLLVMASGNSSKFLNDQMPANFQAFWFNGMWVGPNYPILLSKNEELSKRIILVGSMKEDGVTVSRFSNLPGLLPQHFIFAPGENVNSTVNGNKFDRYSGTSMASPHVTGIVALVSTAFPNLDMTEVKQCIIRSGDAFWNDKDNKFPREFVPTIHGNGRINAVRAYQMAQQMSLAKGQALPQAANAASVGSALNFEAQAQIAGRMGLAHGMGRLWVNADFRGMEDGENAVVQQMEIDDDHLDAGAMSMSD